jgi:hypothetical protein
MKRWRVRKGIDEGMKRGRNSGSGEKEETTTNLIHQHLVPAFNLAATLEPLLFTDDGVEKVHSVDVGCLCKLSVD